jgi:hypothetical protein
MSNEMYSTIARVTDGIYEGNTAVCVNENILYLEHAQMNVY